MQQRNFDKKPLQISEQIDFLIKQGLTVPNQTLATHCLSTVSYHRLSAYFKPFEVDDSTNQFKINVTFDDIWHLYVFDKELRLLVMDSLERIEIAFRTSLSNELSLKYGAWWYLENNHFKDSWETPGTDSPAKKFINEVNGICNNKKADDGIKNYYKKYSNPNLPPSWILFENLSFGRCTSLFRFLKQNQDKKEVSKIFGFNPNIVESALECFRYVRNICAHHSRLWNRWFVYKHRTLKELRDAQCYPGTLKEQLVLLHLFNKVISPHSSWRDKLFQLIEKQHQLPVKSMGFQSDWQTDPFWKI